MVSGQFGNPIDCGQDGGRTSTTPSELRFADEPHQCGLEPISGRPPEMTGFTLPEDGLYSPLIHPPVEGSF